MDAAMIKLRNLSFQWTPRSKIMQKRGPNGSRDHKMLGFEFPMDAAIIKRCNFDFQWTP
jgi:hypothetical protein